MRKIYVLLLIVICITSGCSFKLEVLTPAPAETTRLPVIPSVSPPIETMPAPTDMPLTGFTPAPGVSLFYGAYAVENPNDLQGQSFFPVGAKHIYVIWNYQDMRAGQKIKREWYLDGKLWLQREEPWDFAKYGAFGTMKDISIYDEVVGLPSGVYQLQMYIDGVQQPIGANTMFGPENWLNFSILSPDDAISASSSPDNLWSVTVYSKKRIMLRDSNKSEREVFSGREINYLTWFGDSKHFLFVDRDYSGQQAGSPMGIRDDLYIVDVPTRQVTVLYKTDSQFQGYGGPQPSFEGKYISGVIGSGFGDACFVDSKLIFFEVAGDFKSVKAIDQKDFSGIPSATDSFVYPAQEGGWRAGNQYAVTLNGTCGIDQSQMGAYVFDVPNRKANRESAVSVPSSVGDLGYGQIHGVITDAATGKAISGATITCQHNSYTSPAKCSGSIMSDVSGSFVFANVFFHDTDTIKLTVSAPGYQSQEYTQNSFTFNDLTVNFALKPVP